MAAAAFNKDSIEIHHIENINSLSSEEILNLKDKIKNSIVLYKKTRTYVKRKTIINAIKPLLNSNSNSNISQYFANNRNTKFTLNNVTNNLPFHKAKIKKLLTNKTYSNTLKNIKSKSTALSSIEGKDVFYPYLILSNPTSDIKFKPNCGFIYLELDNIIIGYLLYTYKKNPDTKAHIYIDYVEVHPNYTGHRLCNKLILELIKLKSHINKFELLNVGGLPAFKCYVNTFIQNGFAAKQRGTDDKKNIRYLLNRTQSNIKSVSNGNINNISRFKNVYLTGIIFEK